MQHQIHLRRYLLTKGTECTVAADLFLNAINELGYRDATITYKSDQEPALVDVIHVVSASRSAKTLPEHSPVGSSQFNGSSENAVSIVKRILRRGKLAIERRFERKLPLKHMSVPWMLMHGCFCHNRFAVGEDGKTPYERSRGKTFDRAMVEFGEQVLYVKPHNHIGPNLNQADVRAESGLFLGVRPISSEILIGTPHGVEKVRTIHRMINDKRWNLEFFESFRGLPWKWDADDVHELPAEEQMIPIEVESGDPVAEPNSQDDENDVNRRGFKIYAND